jgi:hypothetical protein
MLRHARTLIAGVALLGAATFGAVSVAAPASAATVDIAHGPLSIGDYCRAKVDAAAWIGFYESGGLRCYASGSTGTRLRPVGSGDPYLACKHLTTDVVMSAFRGTADSLVCRVIR